MNIKHLVVAALFALPLAACDKGTDAEVGQQGTTAQDTAAVEGTATSTETTTSAEQEGIELDQDLVEQNSTQGEDDGIEVNGDLTEDRAAGINNGR
jgi:hypothetical protein